MKTNIEKAIDCLKDTFDNATGHYIQNPSEILVTHENALEAIKIASKTNWYYPSKGEFPKHNDYIVVIDFDNNEGTEIYWEYDKKDIEQDRIDWAKDVKTWAYLPKYEENESNN